MSGISTAANAQSPAQLAEIVRECRRQMLPIIDYGAAHGGLGNPPPQRGLQLRQAGGIIEHYERDMTVRVAAGMSIADLRTQLGAADQFFPLDADDDITLGEAIVHNVYGPLRQSYGACRDLLLGLRYVDDHGREIHVGGRTVKNVAGYDVTRFMVGSLGEFGILHEATLRTYARPAQTVTAELLGDDPSVLDPVLYEWMLTDAAPAWMQWRREDAAWKLSVGYYGRPAANQVQLRALRNLAEKIQGLRFIGAAEADVDHDFAARREQRAWRRSAAALVKVIVPPAASGQTCRFLAQWNPALRIDAMPTHGCIFAGGELDAAAAIALDKLITDHVSGLGGVRAWHERPPASLAQIMPFGPAQDDWAILNRLKYTMDADNLFNPGRFLPVETASQ